MKIAFATNDGNTVSQHFGRSRFFKIYTIKENKISNEELRERHTGHHAQGHINEHEHVHEHDHTHTHGNSPEHDAKHDQMAMEIADCQIMVCGGMGNGAYMRFMQNGINVILTDQNDIKTACELFINGNLKNFAADRTH
jgi:predicted Fe-Mo cluster-binding NifX family protein